MAGSNSAASLLAERVVVILVQPQHAGNVGAAARAMKNMGLRRLTLVDPPAWDPETARWMAPGCEDILGQTRLVSSLDEALEGITFAVASTARHRKQGHPVFEPRDLVREVFDAQPDRVTGILFGREDSGLSNRDVNRCAALMRIPTPEHASLNLGQAVLLVCHSLFEGARQRGLVASGRSLGGRRGTKSTATVSHKSERDLPADLPTVEPAVEQLVGLLQRVGYLRNTPPDKAALTARQALQQAQISRRHTEALRGMISRVEWALDHPEVDWEKTAKR